MAGIWEISDQTVEVPIGNQMLTVGGLTAENFAYLMGKFSAFRTLFMGGGMTAETLQSLGPTITSEMIACACACESAADHDRAVKKIRTFPISVQMKALAAILKITFPDGNGPFVEDLKDVAARITLRAGETSTETLEEQSVEQVVADPVVGASGTIEPGSAPRANSPQS